MKQLGYNLTLNLAGRRSLFVVKALNVDTGLLDRAIDKSGLKNSFICEKLGISKQAWSNRRRGITAFRQSEIYVVCSLLRLNDDEATKIFFPKS